MVGVTVTGPGLKKNIMAVLFFLLGAPFFGSSPSLQLKP